MLVLLPPSLFCISHLTSSSWKQLDFVQICGNSKTRLCQGWVVTCPLVAMPLIYTSAAQCCICIYRVSIECWNRVSVWQWLQSAAALPELFHCSRCHWPERAAAGGGGRHGDEAVDAVTSSSWRTRDSWCSAGDGGCVTGRTAWRMTTALLCNLAMTTPATMYVW